jgi:cell division protein FtsZ
MANFTVESEGSAAKTNIKVVGVGGGGGNAMNTMVEKGIKDVEFIAINTDSDALSRMQADVRIQIGEKLTRGLGAGGKPEIGRESAEETADEIAKAFKGADMVFISAGMGGGTGTGAAPVVARIAKEMGILTVAFVTTPFSFEGNKKMKLADAGIEELRKNIDALIVVPNQKLQKLDPMPFKEAFQRSNQVLTDDVKAVAEIITIVGDVNIDFADVKSTLKDCGVAHMAFGHGQGKDRATESAQNLLTSPLLETSLKGAKRLIVYMIMSADTMMEDVEKVSAIIQGEADADAEILPGYRWDDELKDQMNVVVIATDFPEDEERASGITKVDGAVEEAPEAATTNNSIVNDLQELISMFPR